MQSQSPAIRPPYIERALEIVRAHAFTHPSSITAGELLELSHYVAWLERQLYGHKPQAVLPGWLWAGLGIVIGIIIGARL